MMQRRRPCCRHRPRPRPQPNHAANICVPCLVGRRGPQGVRRGPIMRGHACPWHQRHARTPDRGLRTKARLRKGRACRATPAAVSEPSFSAFLAPTCPTAPYLLLASIPQATSFLLGYCGGKRRCFPAKNGGCGKLLVLSRMDIEETSWTPCKEEAGTTMHFGPTRGFGLKPPTFQSHSTAVQTTQ